MPTKTKNVAVHKWVYGPPSRPDALTTLRTDTDTVTAVFSRKRPDPLSPTVLRVVKDRYNPSSYTDRSLVNFPAYQNASRAWTVDTFPHPDDALRASSRASSKFYSDLNLGETLGEFRSTARMVSEGVSSLYHFSRSVQEVGFRRSLQRFDLPSSFDKEALKRLGDTKSAANAYLAMKFGWGQLASDAYNAVSGAFEKSKVGSEVKGNGRSSLNQESILGKGNAGVRVYLSGRVSNSAARDLNRLGLLNPARTAWQLTRLSFVADWWLGLASALGYYSWSLGLSQTWNVRTVSRVSETIYTSKDVGDRSFQTVTIINREFTSFPIPWVGLVPSSPEVDANLGKAITLAAILRQMS